MSILITPEEAMSILQEKERQIHRASSHRRLLPLRDESVKTSAASAADDESFASMGHLESPGLKRARRSIAGGRDKPPQRAGVFAVSEREMGNKNSLTMSSTVSVISRHQQALQQQAQQQRRRATAATSMGAGESSWSGAWTNCRACARHLCGSCRLVLIQAVVVLCSVLFLLGFLVAYVRAVQRLRGLETRL